MPPRKPNPARKDRPSRRSPLDLKGENPAQDYFHSVDERLRAMKASRGALARQLEMNGPQLSRYFTMPNPNPTLRTIIAIERGIVTMRRRMAAEATGGRRLICADLARIPAL